MPEHSSATPTVEQPGPEPEKKSRLDLSPVQVMGGALAAMTAAGLGSRLGAEGTIVGAALASVIAAVAGALYTASLRRTSAVVRGALGGRRGPAAEAEARSAPGPGPGGSTAALDAPSGPARTNRRRTLILSSVVGAVAIFALAGGALTLYEAFAGQALSGGDGTTFSQVRQDDSGDRPADDQSPSPTESAEPSESAEQTPTAESSQTPEAETAPTTEPAPEPSVEPSAGPSADPSATAGSEPSAAAEPPSDESTDAAPEQNAQTPG